MNFEFDGNLNCNFFLILEVFLLLFDEKWWIFEGSSKIYFLISPVLGIKSFGSFKVEIGGKNNDEIKSIQVYTDRIFDSEYCAK